MRALKTNFHFPKTADQFSLAWRSHLLLAALKLSKLRFMCYMRVKLCSHHNQIKMMHKFKRSYLPLPCTLKLSVLREKNCFLKHFRTPTSHAVIFSIYHGLKKKTSRAVLKPLVLNSANCEGPCMRCCKFQGEHRSNIDKAMCTCTPSLPLQKGEKVIKSFPITIKV